MRRIQDPNLAQLLMQLRFTPETKRRAQLAAAEQLYEIVQEDQEYPFDFVFFKITGFHPHGPIENRPVQGRSLRQDLQTFITKLSGKLAEPAAEQQEKIFTIEQLAEHLDVATKTVNRWRKRGLLAKKYIFSDGARRLGVTQSAIEKFVGEHAAMVSKARQFRRLRPAQRKQIVAEAREMAGKKRLSRYQVIRRTAAKLGVSPETVRCTLLAYERAHPDKAVSIKAGSPLAPAQATEMHKLHRQGIRMPELVLRFGRSRTTIYRIINQRRAMLLLGRQIDYIASDEFLAPDAPEKILGPPIRLERDELENGAEPFAVLAQELLPEYLQILKTTPILNHEQEVDLFRRYNYLKYLAVQVRSQIKLTRVASGLLTQIEEHLAEAEQIKRILVEANLRLVVSIASKHATAAASFPDLVSKGNYALINAVEEFDYSKGHRFSKRAALNIAKEYAKVSEGAAELTRKRAASLAHIQRGLREPTADILALDQARRSLTEVMKQELDERQQYVILHHFGLTGSPIRREIKTLKQIGEDLGLTKERVRQIELAALQKLRQSLSEKEFELLTG